MVVRVPTALSVAGVPVRVYAAEPGASSRPIVIYLHGGMFAGGVERAEPIAQALAEDGAVVVAVDYPQAPEHPFPAGLEATYGVLQWVVAQEDEWGAGAAKPFVAGDEAGGNLAAGLAMLVRDRRGKPGAPQALAGQILITPMLDSCLSTPAMTEAPDCPCLQAWRDYLPKAQDRLHPYAAPLQSMRLANLAPALILSTELDPLRDEANLYAKKLIGAKVAVSFRSLPGSGLDKRADGRIFGLADPDHPSFAETVKLVSEYLRTGRKH